MDGYDSKISYVKSPNGLHGKNWNFVYGCTPISNGCDNCYAAHLHTHRYNAQQKDAIQHATCWEKPFSEIIVIESRLKLMATLTQPRVVMVCSSGDLFHKDVPNRIIERAFGIMRSLPQHKFIVLTKRPERMKEYINVFEAYNYGTAKNIFLGITVEGPEGEYRFDYLAQTNWNALWVCFEPLIDQVSEFNSFVRKVGKKLKGVIVGGESGRLARPMHPRWVYIIKEVCESNNILFRFNQWGRWLPQGERDESGAEWSGTYMPHGAIIHTDPVSGDKLKFRPMGKRPAGKFLDGREYLPMPWLTNTKGMRL